MQCCDKEDIPLDFGVTWRSANSFDVFCCAVRARQCQGYWNVSFSRCLQPKVLGVLTAAKERVNTRLMNSFCFVISGVLLFCTGSSGWIMLDLSCSSGNSCSATFDVTGACQGAGIGVEDTLNVYLSVISVNQADALVLTVHLLSLVPGSDFGRQAVVGSVSIPGLPDIDAPSRRVDHVLVKAPVVVFVISGYIYAYNWHNGNRGVVHLEFWYSDIVRFPSVFIHSGIKLNFLQLFRHVNDELQGEEGEAPYYGQAYDICLNWHPSSECYMILATESMLTVPDQDLGPRALLLGVDVSGLYSPSSWHPSCGQTWDVDEPNEMSTSSWPALPKPCVLHNIPEADDNDVLQPFGPNPWTSSRSSFQYLRLYDHSVEAYPIRLFESASSLQYPMHPNLALVDITEVSTLAYPHSSGVVPHFFSQVDGVHPNVLYGQTCSGEWMVSRHPTVDYPFYGWIRLDLSAVPGCGRDHSTYLPDDTILRFDTARGLAYGVVGGREDNSVQIYVLDFGPAALAHITEL